jgi:restriction system protein
MSENEVAVPDFQSLMLPCLQIVSDGNAHVFKDIVQEIGEKLELTDEQRTTNLGKTGSRSTFTNNVNFALSYLFMASLIEKPRRASFRIAEVGQTLLEKKPEKISIRFLSENYPSFAKRQKKWRKSPERTIDKENGDTSDIITEEPPEVILEKTHSILRSDLAQELLDQVKKSHWSFFERLVVDLLTKMGYGGSRQDAARVVGKSGDNGIDGVIKEDKLGLDVVYIQAKRYTEPITISQVRDFAGALLYKKARKGVFITTSSFPKTAEDFVATIEQKIILIDGQRLAELMIEYDVVVAVKDIYEVKRIDYDYFDENEL